MTSRQQGFAYRICRLFRLVTPVSVDSQTKEGLDYRITDARLATFYPVGLEISNHSSLNK